MVVLTAGVDGRLDLSLAALWGETGGGTRLRREVVPSLPNTQAKAARTIFLNKLENVSKLAVNQLSTSNTNLPAVPEFFSQEHFVLLFQLLCWAKSLFL